MSAVPALAAEDLAVLRFAGEFWVNAAARERAIVERFGVTPVRFYQRVARLVDDPAAQAAEPLIVARLRRLREQRASIHGGRRVVGGLR